MPDVLIRKELNELSVDELLHEIRAREEKAERDDSLREFDDKAIVDVLIDKQKVIYGTDDRIDVFLLPEGQNKNDVDSVVALFTAADVIDNGNGTSTLRTQNYGAARNLCPGERFREQPIGAFCSGFLVAPNVIATAGHCVDAGNVTNVRFVFGFRMRNETTAETVINNSEIYRGVKIIGRQEVNNGPDWALVFIDRPVTNHRIAQIRRSGKIADNQDVHVIGHPSGLPTKFAGGAVVRNNQPNAFFVANLDTYGGNSGSPVFNSDTHEVEGILVRGETDFVQQGSCRVSLVFPNTGGRGEDCTRTTEFVDFLLEFTPQPAVFATKAFDNKKSIYLLTINGQLAQLWDTNQWNLDFPAEAAGYKELRFQGIPAVFPTNAVLNQKSIYVITTDGRLAQIWDGNGWKLDFPAEAAGYGALRFHNGAAVFPTNAGMNKKSIYAITTDGRLAQIWDANGWSLEFPAEAAGDSGLRFQGIPAVFPTDAAANKKSIYAITTDGRLAQIWDTNRWNLDFPAEAAGYTELRFQGIPAVFPTNAVLNQKSIYVITTDGRLAQIYDGYGWKLDFPAEAAGHGELRFQKGVAVFPTNAGMNKKSIYAVTTDGRLAQIWDTNRWNLDFPAEAAGHTGLRFQGIPAVFPTNAVLNQKSIYSVTAEGRLAQIWDGYGWKLDFPAELARS